MSETYEVTRASNGDYWQANIIRDGTRLRKESIGPKSKWSKTRADWWCVERAAELNREPGKAAKRGAVTLSQWEAEFLAKQTDRRERTVEGYRTTFKHLRAHFGDVLDMNEITASEADDWVCKFRAAGWKSLDAQGRVTDENAGLAAATVFTHYVRAHRIFRRAAELGRIRANVFEKVECRSPNHAPDHGYCTLDDLQAIMNACRDDAHRALFAIARLAGLRANECRALRWVDIQLGDNAKRRYIHVLPPQDEAGSARRGGRREDSKHRERYVPLSEELNAMLSAWRARAPKNSPGPCAIPANNLYRRLPSVLSRAKVEVYGKPLQTLRANREDDWLDEGHDWATVSRWMGHSAVVAYNNYLMRGARTSQAFAAAAGCPKAAPKLVSA